MSRDTVINDLMRRRPKGPKDKKIAYTIEEGEFSYNTGKYKQVAVPSDHQYGYTDEALFDLQFKQKEQVKTYIRERDFEGVSDWRLGRRKATLNRRTNIIWSRIEDAVYRVGRDGGEGVYTITRSYGGSSELGNLYARTTEEAKETANLFFGYLYPDDHLRVKFIRRGVVRDISEANMKTISKIQTHIKSAKKEIEEQQNKIEKYKAMVITLQTVESQQIAVETIAALDKASSI